MSIIIILFHVGASISLAAASFIRILPTIQILDGKQGIVNAIVQLGITALS
jgi:hypothetical protein